MTTRAKLNFWRRCRIYFRRIRIALWVLLLLVSAGMFTTLGYVAWFQVGQRRADARKMVAERFAEGDLTVLPTAEDGEAWLSQQTRSPPDLLLLDVILPGMDGIAFLARLRANDAFSNLSVIVISSHSEIEEKRRAFLLGVLDFISKPYQEEELQLRVRVHSQATLARTLFPLAAMSKPEVRALGRALGLHLAEKSESQEICFVGTARYDSFIEQMGRAPELAPGPIRHVQDGRDLGSHTGFWRYTVGQRKGLQVAHSEPLYVVRVEPQSNTVWVGEKHHLPGTHLVARDLSWCGPVPSDGAPCTAKISSRSLEAEATLHFVEEDRLRVEFTQPQQAITPGQAVVFYRGDEVLGGGWIAS